MKRILFILALLVPFVADAQLIDIKGKVYNAANGIIIVGGNILLDTSGSKKAATNGYVDRVAATKQGSITLTTTGSSGAATLVGSTLNIPQYSGGGGVGASLYFNVVDYGADPTGVANSTAAIHAAQDAAALVKGTVYFPHGDYKAAHLIWNVRTNWLGESEKGVSITALNTFPLITKSDSATLTDVSGYSRLSNFTLYAGSQALVGLDLQGLYWSTVSDLNMVGFDTAIKNQGTLTCTFRDIRIAGGNIGIYSVRKNLGGDIAANLLRFDRIIVSANLWCIYVDHGSLIYVDNCDFEATGAPSLPTTSGCIHMEHHGYGGEGTGLHLNNTWFEVNSGTCVDIQQADYPVVNEINFCHFIYTGNRHNCVYAGANNTVNLISSNFHSLAGSASAASNPHEADSLNVWADNGSTIQSTGCISLTNIKETNGGRYINLDVDHLLNGDGDAGTPYRDKVIADAPIYYNRLNQAGGTQTPTIGTDNIVITGEYTPQSAGILKNDTSSYALLMTRASTATCALDLSAYTSVAIEFWSYNEPMNGPALFYGFPAVGGFIVSENPEAQFGAIATIGNVGDDYPTFPFIKRAGWYHYVFFVSTKGVTKIVRHGADGKMTWVNPGVLPNNTNNFSSAGFSAIRYGVKMEEFAIYAGTIPSLAAFDAHYYSRNNH